MKTYAHKSVLFLVLSLLLHGGCSKEPEADQEGESVNSTATQEPSQQQPEDIIARVGDQVITFSELNITMNSAPVVGMSMPSLGTPERDTLRVTFLDNFITGNLLYLDALKQGVDKDPDYQNDMEDFSDSILAALYRQRNLVGDIEVSDEEIQDYFKSNIMPGTEFTEEVSMAIGASIRKDKFKARAATMRNRLRDGVVVVVHEQELNPEDDEVRAESEVVASIDGEAIGWGEVMPALMQPINKASLSRRLNAINNLIDSRIMTRKAKAAGLEKDPLYKVRFGELSKNRLTNLHRMRLLESMEPSEDEISTYFEENRSKITMKELRQVQMVVLETKEEAEAVKQKIEAGELTMFTAARDHSVAPDARKTLGEIGWVAKGSGFPELDTLTFSLGPNEIGGPVQSPAGWHLVMVQDVQEETFGNLDDEVTRKRVRQMILDERLNQYVVNLRLNEFQVEVYEDKLNTLAQQEADWYAKVSKERELSPEELQAQIEKLRR